MKGMTKPMVQLDFDKVKRLAGRLPRRDKAELARYLDERTLFTEVRRVRRELKSLPITKAELGAEVHAAKKARAARARRTLYLSLHQFDSPNIVCQLS
jgi:hypothetical protein